VSGFPALDLDPFDEEVLANPYAHHAALRDAGPVVWLEKIGCYGMARYAEVQPALKDWETFISGRGVGLSDFARETPWRPPSLLLETDPPVHDRTRGLMNKVASLASLRALMPKWRAKADALVAKVLARRRADAVPEIAEEFPLRVFPELIGLREDGLEHLIPYGTTAFNGFGPQNRILRESMASAADAIDWVNESCKPSMQPPTMAIAPMPRPSGWCEVSLLPGSTPPSTASPISYTPLRRTPASGPSCVLIHR